MGYYTYITGGLTVRPPIKPSDEEAFSEFLVAGGHWGYFHSIDVEGDQDVQIVNGQITVVGQTVGHTQLDWAPEESGKFYRLDEDLVRMVETAKRLGYRVDGVLYGDGEESEDFWRLEIADNVITQERGVVTYPSERYTDLTAAGQDKHNHGWVIPRPDGAVAKCGGPMSCPSCKGERATFMKLLYGGTP